MWYYQARMYSPTLGRFMQSDPIGYGDGAALYNGTIDAFAGGLTAFGYKRLSRFMTGKDGDIVADVVATLLPAAIGADDSGPCAGS